MDLGRSPVSKRSYKAMVARSGEITLQAPFRRRFRGNDFVVVQLPQTMKAGSLGITPTLGCVAYPGVCLDRGRCHDECESQVKLPVHNAAECYLGGSSHAGLSRLTRQHSWREDLKLDAAVFLYPEEGAGREVLVF